MFEILTLFVGLVIGGGIAWLFIKRRTAELADELRRTECEKTAHEEIASSLDEYNVRLQQEKDERKESIIKKIQEDVSIQNNEVADMFEVSRKTAYNYLEELETEGKIKQVGSAGRHVIYKMA